MKSTNSKSKYMELNTEISVLKNGVLGVVGVGVVHSITPADVSAWIQVVLQIAIAASTIYAMFQKAKQPIIQVQKEKEKETV